MIVKDNIPNESMNKKAMAGVGLHSMWGCKCAKKKKC